MEQESISDSEKLVYLRHSLNDGTAKSLIEGLSRSGECYQEAIKCLKSRYNRPRLTDQTYVRKLLIVHLSKMEIKMFPRYCQVASRLWIATRPTHLSLL